MKRIFSLIVALVAVQVVSLAVDIDLTRTSYYVKVDGTGDGSSWETAMSSESFAYALPKVGDDVTFYVAEGTYFPIYDIDNNRVLDKFVVHRPSRNIRNAQPVPSYKATFVVNSDVSIKGGYPANSVTGSKNDPSKYKTIFSGDFLKNDEVLSTYYKSEYGNESDIVEITNVEDDCTALFTVKPSVKAIGETASSCVYDGTDTNNYFELEGVVLLNGNAVIKGVGLNLKTTIINSRIENGYISLLCKNHSLVVDDCVFYQSNCLNVEGEGKNIKITNSSFEEILGECTIKGQADDLKSTEVIFNSNKIFHANSFYFVIDNSYVKIHNCNINNNTNLVFDLSYDSVEIDNCNFTENTEKYYDNLIYLDNVADALIDSCVFYKNHCNIGMFQSLWGIMHKFENCLFESNTMGEGYDENNYLLIMESADFTKCTFLNNIVEGGDLIRNYGNNISNCTFVGNKVGNLLPTSYQNFYNNTVVGNFVSKYVFFQSYDAGVTDFYGNIVLGNNDQYDPICGYSNSCSSIIMDDMRYNLMMYVRDEGTYGEFYMPDNNTNIFVRPFSLGKEESTLCSVCSTAYKEYEESVLTSIFQGSYNSTTHVFTPVMDRSSYLPVVALKSDKLSDGTSLRFPLTETIVTEDQRNAARLKNTCMGAYEIPCEENVTTKKETIIVGTTFLGVTYTKSGVYEFAHKTTDENGCEATVNYTLTVKPDASLKEYFVKTESQGTGDGSSWDNAMSGADFAMVFPEVASGTKFYIAAGKYLPMYDSNGKVPTRNYDKEFFTKKCVSLYGGFPSSAKGTDLTNDPTKYKTILSGDFDGNSVYDKDDTKQEDAQYILRFFPVESGDIVVNGIEFQGTCQHYSAGSAAFNLDSEIKGVTCNVEKCTFTLAEIGLIANSSSLIVTDCYFHENNYLQNTLSGYADECVVTNCTFEGKKGNRTCSFGEGNVSMQNCTSVGNISVYTATGFNFVNNTLVGDLTMSRNQQCTLTGNILGGVVSITDSPVTSSYNIYLDVNSENEFISSTDLVRAEADMMPSDGKIVLANHGGFTPTIALESDKLADGTSIRFPLTKSSVTTDQRGVKRLENTCMGAYEIVCQTQTKEEENEIFVGEKFLSVVYDKMGSYEVEEKTTGEDGCELIIKHSLLVKPLASVKEYYVKTERHGTGDGSSWENAMNGEDFATSLPLVPDGVTFHVAEGTYNFNELVQGETANVLKEKAGFNIIGSYPKTAVTGDVPNAMLYKTLFTADADLVSTWIINGETVYDENLGDLNNLHDVYVRGVDFNNILIKPNYLNSFSLDSCNFNYIPATNSTLIYGYKIDTMNINSCYFDMNYVSAAMYLYESDQLNIKNSTFTKCVATFTNGGLMKTEYLKGDAYISNCTFTDCAGRDFINLYRDDKYNGKTYFYNNTIVGNGWPSTGDPMTRFGSLDIRNCVAVGNIYAGNYANDFYSKPLESHNNLFSDNFNNKTDDDLTISDDDLTTILDGEMVDGMFKANLADNGGFAPTIALKIDKLTDGTSIRFPLTESSVTTDQRGVTRMKNTCMGAYEISCEENVTTKKETIIVGTTFLGVTYTESGVYEFSHKTTDENGCEATVNYTLTVKPDASLKEYFVKTESQGTGDGSSWDNAMSGADFAMVFPEVASGTKFYMAEGEYQPMYGTNGKVPTSNYDKEFFTRKCVSLYGGFPSTAKGTDLTNDPSKYHTILSGDFDNNDVYDASKPYADTRQEDAQNILRFIPEESGDIIVSGIEFKGTSQHSSAGSAAIKVDSNIEGVTCNIEKCTISLAEYGLIAGLTSLTVTDCYFYNNYYMSMNVTTDECMVTNCTFDGNRNCYFGKGDVSMQNCTSMGEISAYDVTGFNFVNNTLVGNLILSEISQCKLTGNILGGMVTATKSPVTSSYNIYLDVNSENEFIASTDLVRSEADMMPSDGKIVLANHGGFTKTIALESDKLPDGTSIRFPLSETTVTTDQRGVKRFESTCMGAYEIEPTFEISECVDRTLLFREDFGGNEVSDPIYGPDEEYFKDVISGLIYSNHSWNLGDNGYSTRKEAIRRSEPNDKVPHVYSTWYADFGDHTYEDDLSKGYFMQVDIKDKSVTFYKKQVDDLCENSNLIFSFWGRPVNYENVAFVKLTIETIEGKVLSEETFSIDPSKNEWQQFELPFIVPLGYTSVVYKVYSSSYSQGGDFALDDIEVYLCKPSVKVNSPICFCNHTDYTLTATVEDNEKSGLIPPYTYTWFRNEEKTYDSEGWVKVGDGPELHFEDMTPETANGYYRCVVTSYEEPGFINNCSSLSDIISVNLKQDDSKLEEIHINVGESYKGVKYDQAGVFKEQIIEHSYEGCDKKVTVYVHPTAKEYYVKTERHGTGDGSSWENAMNGDDFATWLPLAPDGATFYVGNGRYTFPKKNYDPNSSKDENFDPLHIYSSVNIKGGFESESDLNYTLFDADYEGNDPIRDKDHIDPNLMNEQNDNNQTIITINESASNVKIESIKFMNARTTAIKGENNILTVDKCDFESNSGMEPCISVRGGNTNMTNCKFKYNIVSNTGMQNAVVGIQGTAMMDNCILEYNDVGGGGGISTLGSKTSLEVKNSTFNGNVSRDNDGCGFSYINSTGEIKILNCTFFDNQYGSALLMQNRISSLNNELDIEFVNNTVVSNTPSDVPLIKNLGTTIPNVTLIGNIFYTNGNILSDGEYSIKSLNNLYVGTEEIDPSESDIFVEDPSLLYGVIDGSINTENKYVVTLSAENGGFTPTVALKDDKLTDGTSIRFPLSETIVTTDQRGITRLENTCMGAYEIVCLPQTKEEENEIYVGEKFLSEVFYKVGRYEIEEKTTEEDGCEVIINHTLLVKPLSSVKEYYVKTERHGTGDGSSWENAMNGEDFATYLPLVSDDVTFHIAEGTYMPYYDEEGKQAESKLLYTVNSSVTIMGGYAPDEEDETVPNNPKKYHTILTVDKSNDDYMDLSNGMELLVDPSKDDIGTGDNLFDISKSSQITIDGVEFRHCDGFSGNATVNVNLRRCTFEEMVEPIYKVNDLTIDSCYFSHIFIHTIPSTLFMSVYGNVMINNSTFTYLSGRENIITLGYSDVHTKSLVIENSTFVGNNSESSLINISSGSYFKLINNTFVNNNVPDGVTLITSKVFENLINGNIFIANGDIKTIIDLLGTDNQNFFTITNNLFESIEMDNNVTASVNFDAFMDGYYIRKTFIANLQDNGGFTPTVALLSDKLSDGTSIRFPLTETTVSDDQRGVARLVKTCMGAYETGCSVTPVSLKDTILVGTEFLGTVYNSVGRQDDIIENLKSKDGCDSVVTHTLFVKPVPSELGYFVKTERQGTGDGSSWDNAMSGEDFAAVLNLVESNSKFYIAEGSYEPIYNQKGDIPAQDFYRQYYSDKCVSLYGGFSKESKGTELNANPATYHTVLNGDLKHNNPSNSKAERNADYRGDDLHNILKIDTDDKGIVNISGIEFFGGNQQDRSGSSLCFIMGENCTYQIDHCIFSQGENALSTYDCYGSVSDCYFNNNYYCGLSVSNKEGSETHISNSTFENSGFYTLSSYNKCMMDVTNCTFLKTENAISCFSGSKCVATNNTIVGGVSTDNQSELTLMGNIINGVVTSNGKITSSRNVYSDLNTDDVVSSNDMKVSASIIEEVLEDNGHSTKYNGGFTPTIALNADILSDGSTLRFPIETTNVTTDQRGVERFSMTCMGAYETDMLTKLKNPYVADVLKDIVCAGADYESNGWSFSSATLRASNDYPYYYASRVIGTNALCDIVEKVELYIKQNPLLELDYEEVKPTICIGQPYGSYVFSLLQNPMVTWNYQISSSDGTVLSTGTFNDEYFTHSQHSAQPDVYTIYLHSDDRCASDTSFQFKVENLEVPSLECPDTFAFSCRSKAEQVVLQMHGYAGGSMPVSLDGKSVRYQYENPDSYLTFETEYSPLIHLNALTPGKHILKCRDYCGTIYDLKTFVVETPEELVLDVTQITSELNCSKDKGDIEVSFSGGYEPVLEISSENGFTDMITNLKDISSYHFTELEKGEYHIKYYSNLEDCPDLVSLDKTIDGPEPLQFVQLELKGETCQDGYLEAYVTGETEPYTYTWYLPNDDIVISSSPVLNNVEPGFYECVVTDSKNCATVSDNRNVVTPQDLPKLVINKQSQRKTCFSDNFASYCISFANNNRMQPVTALLYDKSGNLVKTATSYDINGEIELQMVPFGTYHLLLRYGTSNCVLDETNYVDNDIEIKPKDIPLTIEEPLITKQTCVNIENASVTIKVQGWDEDNKVYWNDRSIKPSISDLTSATVEISNIPAGKDYYFVVKDACDGTASITIPASEFPVPTPYKMTIDVLKDNVTCAHEKSGKVQLTLAGGINNQSVLLIDGVEADKITSQTISNLGKGVHTFEYRSSDRTCKSTDDSNLQSVEIYGPDPLSVEFRLTALDCDKPSLYAFVKGETSPYSYTWIKEGETITAANPVAPFNIKSGETYGLIVGDLVGCDKLSTEYAVPSPEDLPELVVDAVGLTEKCYQGNNGSVDVTVSAKEGQIPAGMMITIEISNNGKIYSLTEHYISSNSKCHFVSDENLIPGEYDIKVKYGNLQCQSNERVFEATATVEALRKLTFISSKIIDQTCKNTNNGGYHALFDGWSDDYQIYFSKTVTINNRDIKTTMLMPWKLKADKDQKAELNITSLPEGVYGLIFKDKCGNELNKAGFWVQYKPSKISDVEMTKVTCFGNPNGKLTYSVSNWTNEHKTAVASSLGKRVNVKQTSFDESTKIATFEATGLSKNLWVIVVQNQCDELIDQKIVQNSSVDPYYIALDETKSKLTLDCPYSKDGIINFRVKGGSTPYVKVDVTYVEKVHYDKIIGWYTSYTTKDTTIEVLEPVMEDGHQKYDENNEPVFTSKMVDTKMDVPVRSPITEEADSLKYTNYVSSSPQIYGFRSYYSYTYDNIAPGDYRFVYKSTIEGCPDSVEATFPVTTPSKMILEKETLPITCNPHRDGAIAFRPRRENYTSSMAICPNNYSKDIIVYNESKHTTENSFYISQLGYIEDGSFKLMKGEFWSNTVHLVAKTNDDYYYDGISFYNNKSGAFKESNTPYDDIYEQVDIKWYKETSPNNFDRMNMVYADSCTDLMNSNSIEKLYYKNGKVIEDQPVWRESPFGKTFQLLPNTETQKACFQPHVQSVANLTSGRYMVQVTDKKGCSYRDTITIEEPETQLKIDSIIYNEQLASCSTADRRIRAHVSGGWGEYAYVFVNELDQEDLGHTVGSFSKEELNKPVGYGISSFLEPGEYRVNVIDKYGCIVSSPETYNVKAPFTINKIDTIFPECPRNDVEVNLVLNNPTSTTYDVDLFKGTDETGKITNFSSPESYQNLRYDKGLKLVIPATPEGGYHSYGFNVHAKGQECGGFSEITIVDTVKKMTLAIKDIIPVLCNGDATGSLELFTDGGDQPYKIYQYELSETGEKIGQPVVKDLTNFEKKEINDVEISYSKLNGFKKGNYTFTLVDSKGCKQDLQDGIMVMTEPEPLQAEVIAGGGCPNIAFDDNINTETTTKQNGWDEFFSGGSFIQAQNITGGQAPYTLTANGMSNIEDENRLYVPVSGYEGELVPYILSDAMGCQVQNSVQLKSAEFVNPTIDFLASVWSHENDILTFIDICYATDQNGNKIEFDSVYYSFGDNTLELLDKRLYIYDINSGSVSAQNELKNVDSKTKDDNFFKCNFTRLVDEDIAKHMNFARLKRNYIKDNNGNYSLENLGKDEVVNTSVTMTAYLLGCSYEMSCSEFHIAESNVDLDQFLGSLPTGGDIIDFYVAPTRLSDDDSPTAYITLSHECPFELNLYNMAGEKLRDVTYNKMPADNTSGYYEIRCKFDKSALAIEDSEIVIVELIVNGNERRSSYIIIDKK